MSEQNGATPQPAARTFTQEDIERERAHAQHFKQQYDDLSNKFKGVDPEDYARTKSELAEIRKKAALGDPKAMDEWKTQTEAEIRKQVQKDLDEAISRATKYEGENKELRVTDRVFAALSGDITPDMTDFIKQQIRTHGEINEKGEIFFKVDGKEMYAPGSTTQLAGVEHFKAHLLNKFPSAFKAQAIPGAKQPGQKVSPNSPAVNSLADLNKLPDRGASFLRQNPDVAKELLSGAKL